MGNDMSGMKLLSVNVGLPREVAYSDRRGRSKTTTTAIFKQPVAGRIALRTLNLDGDRQADLVGHGGVHKAVYVFASESYRYWEQQLGRADFAPAGQFGENFTTEGLIDDQVAVGDVFGIGDALVEVTQPRVPCFKLGILMGIPDFQKRFSETCRVGFYFKVLQEGDVGAEDLFQQVGAASVRMTVGAMYRLLYFEPDNLTDAEKALEIEALSPGWRQSFADRVAAKN
jgi:MOSC domain-containing protein YiiM